MSDTGSGESDLTRAMELLDVSEATLRVMTCLDLCKPAQALLSCKSSLLSLSAALRLAKDLEVFKREIALGASYRTYKTLEEDVEDLVAVMRAVLKRLLTNHNIETELVSACLRVERQVADLLTITDYPSLSHAHGLLHLLREQLRVLQLAVHSLTAAGPAPSVSPSLLTRIEAKAVEAAVAVGLEKPETDGESSEEHAERKGNRVVALLERIVDRAEKLHLAEYEGNAAQRQVETLRMELEANEDQFKLLKDRSNKVESDLSALQEALAKAQTQLKATKQQLKAQTAKGLLRYIAQTQKRATVRVWKDAVSEPLPVPLPVEPAKVQFSPQLPAPEEHDLSGATAKPQTEEMLVSSVPAAPTMKSGTGTPKSAMIGKPGTAVGKPGAVVAKPVTSPPKSGAATPAPKPGVPPASKPGANLSPRDPVTPKPKHSSPLGIPVAKPGAKSAGKK